MFDKELFYSLCKKYDVELSNEYNKPMMRTEEGVKELWDGDAGDSAPKCQSYFMYRNLEKEYRVSKTYLFEEFVTAC